ncbi:glucose 1-dehydrogenase [Lacihabitans sp. LS3-19]|uniref:SDR family NAD(P)-dependent oxidoreductase n=1 Tax=Lacihabitans sp. LS3-19 TaxID=2487335 RepID=UPI0020CF88A8|nr:glucose 1-dehydrogenase [Lacihabitans sp. LS3-19]MCP9770742.1 glucose 1-dehydrogenase [Lacihabitans sp. LS3-19]
MTNPFSLAGKIALVTGGGSGIGYEITRCLRDAGAKVVITGRRENMLQEAVKAFGEDVFYEVNDVADLSQTTQLVDAITSKYGEIDILVNNAGINMKKPAIEVTDIEFNNIIQTNLNAAFALSREVAKKMIPRKTGSIIMISSMAGYYGIDRVPAYTASKSGIEGLTKALASDWSKHNVRVNAIAPGFIETPMMQTAMNSDPDRMDKALNRTPMGKFGKPEDIGLAAVFLASEAASYITGVSLRVDGGNAIGF